MATSLIIDQSHAIQIAYAFLKQRMNREPPPLSFARFYDQQELDASARDLAQICREDGIVEHSVIDQYIADARFNRVHWVVAFRTPDPPGTASTLHATMVLVFPDTGEAELG